MTDAPVCCQCKKDMSTFSPKLKCLMVCSEMCFHWIHSSNCISEWILNNSGFKTIYDKYGTTSTLTEDQFRDIGRMLTEVTCMKNGRQIKCPNEGCTGHIECYRKFDADLDKKRESSRYGRTVRYGYQSKNILEDLVTKKDQYQRSWNGLVLKSVSTYLSDIRYRIFSDTKKIIVSKYSSHTLRDYIRRIMRQHRWRAHGGYYQTHPNEYEHYQKGVAGLEQADLLLGLKEVAD